VQVGLTTEQHHELLDWAELPGRRAPSRHGDRAVAVPPSILCGKSVDEGCTRKGLSEGLSSVSALFLKKCGVLTDDDEAREIVEAARRRIAKLEKGAQFRLRELFRDKRWEGFSKGARLRAGRLFYEYAAEARHGIFVLPKTSANHQRYEKRSSV
jgi:hypothetical protein